MHQYEAKHLNSQFFCIFSNFFVKVVAIFVLYVLRICYAHKMKCLDPNYYPKIFGTFSTPLYPFNFHPNFAPYLSHTSILRSFWKNDPTKKGIKGFKKYQNFLGYILDPNVSFHILNISTIHPEKKGQRTFWISTIFLKFPLEFLKGFFSQRIYTEISKHGVK